MTLISTNISRPRPAIAKGISSTALPLRPCSSSPSASALRYDELRSVHTRVSTRTYGVAYEEVVGKASPPVERRYIDIGGQNAEGFKSEEKWEELAMKVRRWKMFAVCIQETWRHGDCQLESHGVYFIGHGYAEPKCSRGSGGVGIMLSEEAKEAWIAAGSVVLHFGSRIMAIRLTLMDARDRAVELMLVSAYAPTSSHSAAERQAYADNEDRCFKACRPNEVLVMMADVNASLGVQQPAADGEDADTVLGPFGLPRVNPLGKALHKRLTYRRGHFRREIFPVPAPAVFAVAVFRRGRQLLRKTFSGIHETAPPVPFSRKLHPPARLPLERRRRAAASAARRAHDPAPFPRD